MAQLLTSIAGAVLLELQQIPALAGTAPDHGPVVVHDAAIAVGVGLRVGHHRLKADVAFLPAPAASDHCGFRAEVVKFSLADGKRLHSTPPKKST